jgi:hypothetical protein
LKARAKSSVNTEIFLEYIRTLFLPNLHKLRSLEEFADNCPRHLGEEILTLLKDA